MTEDCKRQMLQTLLPEGEQYIVTMVGKMKRPRQMYCYVGMTEHYVVIAEVNRKQPGVLVQGEQLAMDEIREVEIHRNVFGWEIVTLRTAVQTIQMVLKDHTVGTHLDKNLQLQGVKYLCQRLNNTR
ncbi:MAG: hypothetical protein K6G04_03055 [Lachnospiraceae bacterium]|nr:hypothetical protein [Lachnospiraceae bacterium]